PVSIIVPGGPPLVVEVKRYDSSELITVSAVSARPRPPPFGQMVNLAGVDFGHAAWGIMGTPFGGKNIEATVANESLRGLVFGQIHRYNGVIHPKLGPRRGV